MSIYTNSYINVLGSNESLDIQSNDTQAVIQALQNNPEFSEKFLSNSYALIFGADNESGLYTYPQSVTADTSGVYSLSRLDGQSNVIVVRKLSGSQILWTTSLDSLADHSPSRIRINPVDGYLYVLVASGIIKISPDNGNVAWSYYDQNGGINNLFYSIGFKSNGDLITVSSGNAPFAANKIIIATWRGFSISAVKLSEHEISLAGPRELYINADILVDSSDNVIIPIDYYSNGYGTMVVKWNTSSASVIWQYNIYESYYDDQDQDCTACGMDDLGNIYINGYGRGLTKLSPDGNLIWARLINRYMPGMGVFSNGDCIMYGDPGNDLSLVKINAQGAIEWATVITSTHDLDNGGWYLSANSMAQVVNNRLYLVAGYTVYGEHELIINLGSNQDLGTYSAIDGLNTLDLTFTDNASDLSIETVTPVNDHISITHVPSTNLVEAMINPIIVTTSQTVTKISIG